MKTPSEKIAIHVLTEYTPYSMGFVIVTPEQRAIVIDGGRVGEWENLKYHVGDLPIAAWIVTHPHGDHYEGLCHAMRKEDPFLERVEQFVFHFHEPDLYAAHGAEGEAARIRAIYEYLEAHGRTYVAPVAGDVLSFGGIDMEFLFHCDPSLVSNITNDSSLVFRIRGKDKSILFLGDLGPEGGELLLERQRGNLGADIVQMAHHGHCGVGKAVYEEIAPKACIWCCASWLYVEPDRPYFKDSTTMFGVGTTRRWMRELGVTTHYVTKDGDIVLYI